MVKKTEMPEAVAQLEQELSGASGDNPQDQDKKTDKAAGRFSC